MHYQIKNRSYNYVLIFGILPTFKHIVSWQDHILYNIYGETTEEGATETCLIINKPQLQLFNIKLIKLSHAGLMFLPNENMFDCCYIILTYNYDFIEGQNYVVS